MGDVDMTLVVIIFYVLGALFCFLGYHFFRYLIGLLGFIAGGYLVLFMSHHIHFLASLPNVGLYTLAALGGVIGALLFYFILLRLATFLFGAIATMMVSSSLLPQDFVSFWPVVVLAAGFTGGIAAVILVRPILVFSTSAIGSMAIVAAIGQSNGWLLSVENILNGTLISDSLFDSIFSDSGISPIISLLLACFFIAGVLVQNSRTVRYFARQLKRFPARSAEGSRRSISPECEESSESPERKSKSFRERVSVLLENLNEFSSLDDDEFEDSPQKTSGTWQDNSGGDDMSEDAIWGNVGSEPGGDEGNDW